MKRLLFLCSVLCSVIGCKPIQSLQTNDRMQTDTTSYRMDIKAIGSTDLINQIRSVIGNRTLITSMNFIHMHLLYGDEIQIRCENISAEDLSSLKVELAKFSGIIEVNCYRLKQ